MKKNSAILITVIALVAVICFWLMSGYNGMVTLEEQVQSDWAQVENQYQRRSDLIPNLVATVKGYAAHEQNTLDAVISARAKATQTTISPENLNAESMQAYQAAQGEVGAALGRLLMITENYPDLKANQNFLELQSQLEGTENRIVVARNTFNKSAQGFNTAIRRFPKNIVASIFGFEKKAYFEAEAGAEKAPTVAF